jgi:glycosyltransferase involved in cell wall biosynthesis
LTSAKIQLRHALVKDFLAQGEKKLRILEIVNVRWWNASAQYGINQALGLHRRGHRVVVVGQAHSPPLRRAHQLGLPIHTLTLESYRPGAAFSNLCALMRLIRRERIQVINAHRAEGHLFAALASLLMNRGVVVVRTRGDVRAPKGHVLNKFLHRRLTDAIVLPTQVMRQPLQGFGLPLRKIRVIPFGVDLRDFPGDCSPEAGRRALGWPDQEPVVGIVGRFSPVKGHRVFLEAARSVLESMPQTCFAIVGHEAQIKVSGLRERAERLGVAQRVRFTGFVSQVRAAIAAFDVAVVASTGSEVICRVALEHMAMAKPVVGTRTGAIPEAVVHGSTGLLVPPGDPGAMSEAILSLLQNPSKARALGQAGRRRVWEHFTLDHQVRRAEQLYRQLLREC